MKELSLYDALKIYFETHDDSPIPDVIEWIREYSQKHFTYISYHRDIWNHVFYTLARDEYYLDEKENMIRKQQSIFCPCCGTEHFKYPNIEKFNKIILHNHENENR